MPETLFAYRASDLRCLGSYIVDPGPPHSTLLAELPLVPRSVHASRRAIAICCSTMGKHRTVVYALEGHALGSQLFAADMLPDCSFSADSRWLAGSVVYANNRGDLLRVHDARTGTCVACVPTSACVAECGFKTSRCSVAWDVFDPSQLQLKLELTSVYQTGSREETLMFVRLTF